MKLPPDSQQRDWSAIETEAVDSAVLVTRMRGRATQALCERQLEQFRAAAGQITGEIWIIDALELTALDPRALKALEAWFSAFKQRGGRRIIMVSQLGAVRMAAASLAFAVHVPVLSALSLAEAYKGAGVGEDTVRESQLSFLPPLV